jgi:hypothetical protein
MIESTQRFTTTRFPVNYTPNITPEYLIDGLPHVDMFNVLWDATLAKSLAPIYWFDEIIAGP